MIYLDSAATTNMYKECVDDYVFAACDFYYNPSALYSLALEASHIVKKTKGRIAQTLSVDRDDIYFVASGTEADNIALLTTIKQKKGRVLISAVEHAAVYNTAMHLKEKGYEVIVIPTDRFGRVDLVEYKKLLTKDTVLVSCIHVCNETGAINPIQEIAKLAKMVNPDCIVHSDGVQAYGKIPVNIKALNVDLYSISSHKIHGPKGLGAIYIKNTIHPRTFIFGGGQEKNLRSATENVPAIRALNTAIEITFGKLDKSYKHAKKLQEMVISEFLSIEDCSINTDVNNSSPYIVSCALKNIKGEVLVHLLEKKKIIIGTGSACSAKKGLKRIPLALKLDNEYHDGMIRISFDDSVSEETMQTALETIKETICIQRKFNS